MIERRLRWHGDRKGFVRASGVAGIVAGSCRGHFDADEVGSVEK